MQYRNEMHGLIDFLDIQTSQPLAFYSLKKFKEKYNININNLPVSIKILLESAIRNYDGKAITYEHIQRLATWQPNNSDHHEVPFIPARVILQDYTGIPLLVDLASMRSMVKNLGLDSKIINPTIPTHLVIDHSVKINHVSTKNAAQLNLKDEFNQNKERYAFIKWATSAFNNLKITPPGNGIVHQINLEHLTQGVQIRNNICFPDSTIGTDSHTTMVNALGVLGWGLGGIEAEACMLGLPYYMPLPRVAAVYLHGKLKNGVMATDLALTLTEKLRKKNLVGYFVEFIGEGVKYLSIQDRATIANMAPEYGTTTAFFALDEQTLDYYKLTGKSAEQIKLIFDYHHAQNLCARLELNKKNYNLVVDFNLNDVEPCIAGPKRPQDKVLLSNVSTVVEQLSPSKNNVNADLLIKNGDILVASITSCANTSNPYLILAAGLLAKKAVMLGLSTKAYIKKSLIPGSRAVAEYLKNTGLQFYLDKLGFNIAGYGCGVCNGNGGELSPQLEACLSKNNILACSILSGNRNFESRIHPLIKANFLANPALVIAFSLVGNMKLDLTQDPIGLGENGQKIFLKDIWPSYEEIDTIAKEFINKKIYQKIYFSNFLSNDWNDIPSLSSDVYLWDEHSSYISNPQFLNDFSEITEIKSDIYNARALLILGNSITTDHISPVGKIEADSPAGLYLQTQGVTVEKFNSYGSRRGNHEVMLRGAFSNNQVKNLMLEDISGGLTRHYPSNEIATIYEAAMRYQSEKTPLIIIAGEEYGSGSSRDWAAKATALLGVKIVVADSFERIHKSNLICMGVLPCEPEIKDDKNLKGLLGNESFDIIGFNNKIMPYQRLNLIIKLANGSIKTVKLIARIDTPVEAEYFNNGGILPYILRNVIKNASQIN